MCTIDFITELFCRVDDAMTQTQRPLSKHSQAKLHPSEVITLALLFAIKGVGGRAFYRWVSQNYRAEFPSLPERTRLLRLFATHQQWAARFLADPTIIGVADTYGIELIHPYRQGRATIREQIGKKGFCNHRWIVGAKVGMVLNKWGLVCGWDSNTANVHDSAFHPMVEHFKDIMVVLTDHGFFSTAGNPTNMLVRERGEWNDRMMVESVLSMLHRVCHIKHMAHRVWVYLQAHLGYMIAAYNILVQWDGPAPAGLHPDEYGRVHLSIAQFSL